MHVFHFLIRLGSSLLFCNNGDKVIMDYYPVNDCGLFECTIVYRLGRTSSLRFFQLTLAVWGLVLIAKQSMHVVTWEAIQWTAW